MNITNFIQHFANQFDETPVTEFNATTEFKNLEEWSSLMALSIIAMVDEEYGVKIKGIDIRSATNIEDLYNIIKSKM